MNFKNEIFRKIQHHPKSSYSSQIRNRIPWEYCGHWDFLQEKKQDKAALFYIFFSLSTFIFPVEHKSSVERWKLETQELRKSSQNTSEHPAADPISFCGCQCYSQVDSSDTPWTHSFVAFFFSDFAKEKVSLFVCCVVKK